jgi:hypothetical protein
MQQIAGVQRISRGWAASRSGGAGKVHRRVAELTLLDHAVSADGHRLGGDRRRRRRRQWRVSTWPWSWNDAPHLGVSFSLRAAGPAAEASARSAIAADHLQPGPARLSPGRGNDFSSARVPVVPES